VLSITTKVVSLTWAGQWFSLGTPDSFTNKTDCHNKTEILLKVALNTMTLNGVLFSILTRDMNY
jgi:hypothetical protein